MEFCINHFMSSFSLDDVLDVLVVAHLINQKELFDAATDFVHKNKGNVVKTNNWEQLKVTNATLIKNILSKMSDL